MVGGILRRGDLFVSRLKCGPPITTEFLQLDCLTVCVNGLGAGFIVVFGLVEEICERVLHNIFLVYTIYVALSTDHNAHPSIRRLYQL